MCEVFLRLPVQWCVEVDMKDGYGFIGTRIVQLKPASSKTFVPEFYPILPSA